MITCLVAKFIPYKTSNYFCKFSPDNPGLSYSLVSSEFYDQCFPRHLKTIRLIAYRFLEF